MIVPLSTGEVKGILGVKESRLHDLVRQGKMLVATRNNRKEWTIDDLKTAARLLGKDSDLSIRQKIQELELKNVNPFEEAIRIAAQAESI